MPPVDSPRGAQGACRRLLVLGVAVALAAAGAPVAAAAAPARPLCAPAVSAGASAGAGAFSCDGWVAPAARAGAAATQPPAAALSPAQFHVAYDLPTAARRSQTVAVVIPYGAPTIAGDLATFSSRFGLPSCRPGTGCLRIVNQDGAPGPLPSGNGDWPVEAALGVETVHGICRGCRILLVEARSTLDPDLAAAVDTAARLGANEIAISFFSTETFSEPQYASHYDHPGSVIVAASGDSGYLGSYPNFPASLPTVISAGGTHLSLHRDGSYAGETAWSSSGSGCSSFFSAPTWQAAAAASAGCGDHRALNDVAADGDPATGAAIYTSTAVPSQGGEKGWFQVGGTSLAAPLIAGVFALAGGTPANVSPGATLYAHRAALHDITRGANGACGGTPICQARAGYDGPTGLGTPNGLAAFIAGGSAGLDPRNPRFGAVARLIRTRGASTARIAVANRNPFQLTGIATLRSAFPLHYPNARSARRIVAFGSKSFRVAATGRLTLGFGLSRPQRALLARLGKITLLLTIELRDASGDRATVRQRVALE
jgi:hypothetical protein